MYVQGGKKLKKLMITTLLSTVIFGMVGLADAALSSETFTQTYSLDQSTKALFAFDLFGLGGDTSNYSQTLTGITKSGPTNDLNLNPSQFALSAPFSLSFAFSGTSSLNNGAALNVYLYNTIKDATNNVNSFTDTNFKFQGKSTASIDFTDSLLFSNFTDGKFVAVLYGTGLGAKSFTLNEVTFNSETQPVPLPAAGLLMASGLIGFICVKRKRSA
jgi:hypothetical protein